MRRVSQPVFALTLIALLIFLASCGTNVNGKVAQSSSNKTLGSTSLTKTLLPTKTLQHTSNATTIASGSTLPVDDSSRKWWEISAVLIGAFLIY